MISRNMLASLLFAGAVAVAVPAASAGTAAGPPAGGPGSAVAAGVPGGGTLDCSQLEALWESAGGSASSAFMAAEIAMAESSGRQDAFLQDSNGTADEGYWQINTSHGSLATFSPQGNARAAVLISGDGTNWSPWVTYQTGAYAGKC